MVQMDQVDKVNQVNQRFFIKTFEDDHFIKRIWNTFARLDMMGLHVIISVQNFLCSFNYKSIVTETFSFLLNSVIFKSFNLFSTPAFKNFRYDENKSLVKNLGNFSCKTIKEVTTVRIPESRRGCMVFGFLFCILPEFILRKVILGIPAIIAFALLWMTSWVGVFIFIPLGCLLWYIIQFVGKILLVLSALVTAAVLAIGVLLVPSVYLVLMAIFELTAGGIVLIIYPLCLGLRVVLLAVIALIYYIFNAFSVIKMCCFVYQEPVPV